MITIAIEGNGARPSHRGGGYMITDKMYTLNTAEVHGIAYDAEALAIHEATGQDITFSDKAYALNVGGASLDRECLAYCYSIDEKMANTYIHNDIANTLAARDYKQPQTVVYGR